MTTARFFAGGLLIALAAVCLVVLANAQSIPDEVRLVRPDVRLISHLRSDFIEAFDLRDESPGNLEHKQATSISRQARMARQAQLYKTYTRSNTY